MATTSKGPQLFISFRGTDVRGNFLSHLSYDLRVANINVFIDEDGMLGEELKDLLVRIEESEIALVIFSKDYTTSDWCLDELAKIKERKDQGRIKVIPIFYRVEVSAVKDLTGEFGDKFWALERNHRHQPERTRKWKEALESIPLIKGMRLPQQSDREKEFINQMVLQIQRVVASITMAPAKQPGKAANRQGMVASVVPARQLERQTNPQGGSVIPIMVPARELVIDDIDDPMKWAWSTIYDGPNSPDLEILKMIKIHWLKIAGTFETGDLTPGKQYEAVFVVKLEDDACGWEQDVTLKLKVEQHNGSDRRVDRKSNLKEYIGHDWVEILAGVFVVPPSNAPAKITFTMYQYQTDDKKRGLLVKGVVIRPTN